MSSTPRVVHLSHASVLSQARVVADKLPTPARIYPIPRGGVAAAYAVLKWRPTAEIVDAPHNATAFVDDLVDTGNTRARFLVDYPEVPFFALFEKGAPGGVFETGDWLVFPWEGNEEGSADDICTRLLQFIGEDPNREGLRETPYRFLRAWRHWTKGYKEDPAEILKVFEDGAKDYDEMVVVSNIPAWSTCEHHMAPIFGVAHVGYVPNGHIVGLSKLNRLVDTFGRRLQVQERWTNDIANAIQEQLAPLGVAVVIEARHLCMESRGVCHQGTITHTSAMRGVLLDKPEARAEFLRLIGK